AWKDQEQQVVETWSNGMKTADQKQIPGIIQEAFGPMLAKAKFYQMKKHIKAINQIVQDLSQLANNIRVGKIVFLEDIVKEKRAIEKRIPPYQYIRDKDGKLVV